MPGSFLNINTTCQCIGQTNKMTTAKACTKTGTHNRADSVITAVLQQIHVLIDGEAQIKSHGFIFSPIVVCSPRTCARLIDYKCNVRGRSGPWSQTVLSASSLMIVNSGTPACHCHVKKKAGPQKKCCFRCENLCCVNGARESIKLQVFVGVWLVWLSLCQLQT